MNKILLLLPLFCLVGCQRYYVSVMQQKIDVNYLASTHVDTPDPMREHPPYGQELIIDWQVPQALLKKKPLCILRVIYWDYTEETFYYDIKYKVGYWKYALLNQQFEERKGILTYSAKIVTEDGEIYKEWKHQLWVNLIQI